MPISAGLTGKNPNTKSVIPASCNKTAIKEIAATLSQTPPAIISFPCCSNTKKKIHTHIHKPTSEIEWVVPKSHQP
jgi:hypothetical protein